MMGETDNICKNHETEVKKKRWIVFFFFKGGIVTLRARESTAEPAVVEGCVIKLAGLVLGIGVCEEVYPAC